MKFRLKQCPRCRGDLYVGQDIYGEYLVCLQCGRSLEVNNKSVPVVEASASTGAATDNLRRTEEIAA